MTEASASAGPGQIVNGDTQAVGDSHGRTSGCNPTLSRFETNPSRSPGTALDEALGMLRTGLAAVLLVLPSIALAEDVVLGPEQAPEAPVDAPDAPVEVAPAPEVVPPAAMPAAPARGPFAAVVVATPPKPMDLQKRFGVSGRITSLGLTDGATETQYGGGGIAASYRINRRWEVAVALDALDAEQGPDLHSTTLEARFHLTPHRKWDWYALAGIGVLHEVPLEGEHAHDEGVSRARLHLGVGLARRFRSWSIGAELQSVGVGPVEEPEMTTARSTTPMSTDEGLQGGQLTLGATLFF